MNKYLYKKIEQAHSAYFENLIFIANEVCRDKTSGAMEEFESLSAEEICKGLNWRNDKDVHDRMLSEIEDGGLAGMMLRNDMTGFLAECYMPECSNFRTDEGKVKPSSWSVHGGVCSVFWIYAESIGELVEKLENEADYRFEEMYQNEITKAKV